MATRHELIHIDFVANAGKANPVLKSLQVSCNDARIAKEQLDAQLKDAKAMNAPAEVITNLEKKLKSQTTTWQQLERGLREYTKGIDTLSKGIKEFNDGTLDEMSAKFNKAVYNSAKLAQSAVKTGSSDWNQLQRLMDATDRNVTRAREDIDLMMQSIKDGSAVSTVQLTRSRDVLEDLARLAVTNSEEWRGLRKQFNEVDAAITSVTDTEKRLKGEIATEADAIALSNHLTKESISLRHADGEATMKTAQAERKGVEDTMRGISDRIVLLTKERDGIQDEIELQENLNDIIKERNEKILSAQNRKQEAEQRKAQAQATIKEYDEQEQKVAKLKQEKKELEDQQKKETREAEKSAKATEEQNKKQAELTQTVSTLKGEVGGLETSLQGLEEQIKKTSAEPIKPKVDTSKIDELQAKLKAVQDSIAEKNAQIEAESKKGGLANKWQETLTRLQGDKDGRLNPMGLGDDKKQMDDILDVANNFYEIIKKVKGVTEDGFIPTPAAEPVKQLAEYYKITEEEARKLVKTLQKSEVVSKRFATFDYNEQTGFLAINRNNGKDDQQVRIEAAQSYMKAAERREGDLTENVNKLLADRKKLEEEEVEIKGKLKAATEGVAEATVKSGEATERRVNLTKKEKEEVKKLTDENNSLTGTIDALKKQLDSLSVSQDKVTGSVKEGAKAAKGEAESVKMTAEEAKAALDKMREKSTFEFKGGKMVASNLEEAENSLISIVSKSGDYKAVLKAFQEKYQIKEKDQARDIIKQLAAGGKGGLIESGFEREGEFSFTLNEEKRAARIKTMKELLTLSKGVTVATQAQTQADEAQAAELERLNQVWKEKEKLYSQSNSRYLALMGKANSMEGPTEFQGQLTTKGEKLRDAEEYRKKHVAKNRQDANEAKQAYDDYAKSILDGTAATEANTKSQKDNVDVEKQRKQISEQINALEQQKAANTERLTQLQEKGAKATKEQVKADGESVTTGKSMNELLQEKERITSRLTEKQAKLKEAQEELAKMTKEETAAGKEQSDVTEQLTKKTEEYNAETEKLANMKEGRNKARGAIRSADRSISNADDAIATLKNEATPQRKTGSEIGAMKKRVAELTAEVDKETAAFNKNAQAITELNKKETQAAIDMAQSENVSIEKVKQSIELLQKKIQTEAADAETMKQRGEAINRLSERLTQMNAEVVKLSKPIADRLNTKNLGTLNETELQQSIDAAKQLLKTYKTGSDEAKQLADNIVRAEQYMDSVGIKAAKKAAQQAEEIKQERELHRLMNARLKDLSTLSADAMAETKKYWEAQRNGAEAGSKAFEKAEANLKRIDNLTQKRKVKALDEILGDPKHHGISEVQQAVQEMEKLRDSVQKGIPAWQHYNKMVNEGRRYLDVWKQVDSVVKFEGQMAKLPQLSDAALQETKKFWETMVAGAEKGSSELAQYEAHLEKVKQEERERQQINDEIAVERLNDNLMNFSTGEIEEAIKAGERLVSTYKTGEEAAVNLAKKIAAAKEYVKTFGDDTSRAAHEQMVEVSGARTLERAQNGEFATASMDELDKTIKKLKEYQALIKDPNDAGKEAFEATKEQVDALTEQLNKLKGVAEKVKGSFKDADEVLARFGEHLNAGKTASEGMAQSLDEKLSQATSSYDDDIESATESLKFYEEQVKKDKEAVAAIEEYINGAEKRLKSWNPFQQIANKVNHVEENIARAKSNLEGNGTDENYGWRNTLKDDEEEVAYYKEEIELLKQKRDEELRQAQQAEQVEEKKQDAQRLTQEQMQEGIKLLEEEYRKTDHTTEEGIKKRERLRQTIDQMNQEIKESTGEWMSYAEAEKFAAQAGTEGFIATGQQMKQAQEALERQRDSLIKSIQAKRQEKNMTDEQKKALAAEEAQLDKVNAELKKMKFEMDNTNMSAKRMNEILDNPSAAKNIEELGQAVKRAQAQLKVMEDTVGDTNKEYQEMAQKTKEAAQRQKELETQFKASASAFDKAWSRLKTYVGLYVGASVAMNKLVGTMGDLMDLSDKMGEVRKTTGFTADEVGRLSGELKKFDTRTTLNGLLDLSVAAGQLGLKTEEDVLGFTEAANKLMVALPEMGREGATEMLKVALATGEIDKIRKQMEQGLIDGSSATAVAMEKVGSTIDRLRATSAATAPAITDFVKRVGAVGAQSGITIDQVAALGSTVDALGMRVEMSATALSRMIPAIKNNAFALAQAIGVTPETIRNLFDTGRGMEVILMVLQRIKDSGMDADSIEQMLGMAGMKDIMKDLNQQGARAGIVFAGLSQNVDTLRKHLVTANEAYEENIAIQQEYDKMNETTMAKWERLKNQVEEMFVGDYWQRQLGNAIDFLRWIVDLLAGNNGISVALKGIIIYLALVRVRLASIASGALTAIWGGLKNIGIMLGFIKGEMTKLQLGNIFTAAAMAVLYFVTALGDAAKAASAVSKAIAQLEEDLRKEIKTLEELFHSVNKTNVELEKSRSRLEEVKKAGGDATDAENKLKKANADHAATIREINSKYSAYLGYMLSETSSAEQLARARELINSKLRETITLKQREAALGNVEQEFGGNVNKKAASVERTIQTFFGSDYNAAARVSVAISEAAQKYANNSKEYQKAVKKILADNKIQKDVSESYMETFEGYRKSIEEYKKQEDIVNRRFEAQVNVTRKDSREKAVASLNAIQKDWQELVTKYQKAEGDEKEKLAAEVYKQQRNYANSLANNAEYFDNDKRKEIFDKNVKNMATYEKGLRSVAGEAIRTIDAMERAETKVTGTDFTNGGDSANNPWGKALGAESTDWKNMTAEQLVNRRKQMKDFVNAIQTDTDVQSVLKEDAALKAAIEKGMSSDMRTVIEWYNTERLKIQDELHARHLTNTGDWMDPKKERGARKQFRDEMDAYLHELDAYYTERKTRIEEAGTDEGLTEAEIRNRTLNNEMEWQQRRAELQKLYSRKQKEVTQEELDAIYHIIAERTGDSELFVKAQIAKTNQFVDSIEKSGEKGAAIVHRWMSQVELDTERSYMKGQQALTKQMRAIEAIIDKERPFNGITKSLQESLSTMDVLTGDMRKEYNELMKQGKDMTDFNNRQAQEEMKRTAFLLGEAENAYSTNIDRVMDDMRQKGMTAWADWLSADPKLQEALMAQLRSTYDAIQDAIKKEASQLKKQAEIMWNNILMPDGKTTLKQQTDRIVAQLGLDEGRVNRANSLIGAGQASERVADKLAIQQMKVQLAMQEHYYNLMRKQGQAHVDMLNAQAKAAKERGDEEEATRKTLDAQHASMSLNLATAKEETELAKQREEIIARTEESQNRLYTELKSWADLLSSSLQGVMEASHTADREYYNERAKLDLTGKGGPGAGTYIVIDNEGTDDARAHYEYLDERQALERQREIENDNAVAEAWKKMLDDLNQKMSDTITDQMNAMLQSQSIDANTQAVIENTRAIYESMGQGGTPSESSTPRQIGPMTEDDKSKAVEDMTELYQASNEIAITAETEKAAALAEIPGYTPSPAVPLTDEQIAAATAKSAELYGGMADLSDLYTNKFMENQAKMQKSEQQTNSKMAASGQSMFAKLTQAANLYGIAYQAMSNDNLSTSQKIQMIAVQAAGQAGIAMLTADLSKSQGQVASSLPQILAECLKINPIYGTAIFAALSAVLGGLMGVAVSKIAKSKSEISQVTGTSMNAGRLSTGMMTYAEGNVNEFTDPATLTPGRSYNVDAADGRTYRAKYTGTNPKTHITSGPEFHLVGERGQEAIIDAKTTRQIRMDDNGIWQSIQTLYNGGRLSASRRRRSGMGVRAFADGNMDEFEEIVSGTGTGDGAAGGMSTEQMAAFQSSLDRNNELLERALSEGIHARFDVYGKGGLIDSYDQGKKTVSRHGEKF